jgi:uncharacterized protein
MQFSMDTTGPARIITGYSATQLRVGEQVVSTSAIVTSRHVLPWAVATCADITPAALDPVLALDVEVVLLATGEQQVWPSAAVFAHAARRRIGLEVMTIGAACRTFNVLVGDGRAVALAAVLGSPG